MAKYRIKVIQHLIKGNKIAKSGDVIDGSQFINLQESIDGKFVELVKKENSKKVDSGSEPTKIEVELKAVKKLNKDELIAYAVDKNYEINADQNKKPILKEVVDFIENDEALKED
jgi:hypothetical protein